MLAKIKRAIERRKIEKVFGQYVSKEIVNEILEGKGKLEPNELKNRSLAFVLLELRTTAELLPNLSSLIDLAVSHDALVDTIVSNLVVVTFGAMDFSPMTKCRGFVDAALSQFGAQVRIVVASGEGQVGSLGSSKRFSFSFVHPAFPNALAKLTTVPFGEAHEISSEQKNPKQHD